MLLQCPAVPAVVWSPPLHSRRQNPFSNLLAQPFRLPPCRKTKPSPTFLCLSLGFEDVAEIAHNKVLIAAGVSAAVGQLAKPFTSAIFYGGSLDFRAALQAGGFPSSHSSTVVAAATTLALERGFSDSIVGVAIVYACLVMYDAQAVRREVGNHARLLNKMRHGRRVNTVPSKNSDYLTNSQAQLGRPSSFNVKSNGRFISEEARLLTPELTKARVALELDEGMMESSRSHSPAVDADEGSKQAGHSFIPLKESIGHTEAEVLAGALLGLVVGFVMHIIL